MQSSTVRLLVFTSLMLSALVLTNCGGGSDSGPTNNVISLSTVTAFYPTNGANWNDYVKNDDADIYSASDIACDGTETGGYAACLHGGEMRTVTVTGRTSCTGLTAADSLGAFSWLCSAGTGTVQFISTGLKDGKYLSDLLDFTNPAWKANSVTVYANGTAYGRTDSTTWWTNPIVVSNTGGSLVSPGTIYTVTSNVTGTYTLDASKVALVSKPGVTITGPGAGTDSYIIRADGSSTARDFLWFEGNVNAAGDDVAVYLNTVRFASLRGVKAENAKSGTLRAGIYLASCANNALTSVSAANNSYGVYLDSSSNNALTSITAANNNSVGIYLFSSASNVLTSVTAKNSSWGVFLSSSSSNTLTSVTAANNSSLGVYLASSSNNALTSVTASNSGFDGINLESSSNNALSSVTAANNGRAGVYLNMSSNNILSSITAANNYNGIYLVLSSNNALTSATAANSDYYGIYLGSSVNNALTSVTAANNFNFGIYLYSSSNNALAAVTATNNYHGIDLDTSSKNTLSSLTAANNYWGVTLFSSANNKFTGILKVGNNSTTDCYVTGGTSPGLVDSSCANNGSSDAALVAGATVSASFVGRVQSGDTTNTSDSNGTAAYDSIADWTGFKNPFRGWGKDGSALPFPNTSNWGRCTTGNTCRIWDFSLATGDTVIRNVLSLPTGANTLTHTWSDATITTFLRNAVELTGNNNGLCESSETCLYTPNIGAYQGHGSLISAGTFTDGTITGVTLMKYESNGR